MKIENGSIWWVNLKGSYFRNEIGKIRPCVVISNDKRNEHSFYVTILPITSKLTNNKLHLNVSIDNKKGHIIPYLILTITKKRLISKISSLPKEQQSHLHQTLKLLLF